MVQEDFFNSYVFYEATCLPTIHVSGISLNLKEEDIFPVEKEWEGNSAHMSVCGMGVGKFEELDRFYYGKNRKIHSDYLV